MCKKKFEETTTKKEVIMNVKLIQFPNILA